jgi:hypothetical protein
MPAPSLNFCRMKFETKSCSETGLFNIGDTTFVIATGSINQFDPKRALLLKMTF